MDAGRIAVVLRNKAQSADFGEADLYYEMARSFAKTDRIEDTLRTTLSRLVEDGMLTAEEIGQ